MTEQTPAKKAPAKSTAKKAPAKSNATSTAKSTAAPAAEKVAEQAAAPAPAAPTPAARTTNSLAIVAFVLSMFGFISGLGFIAGIICGHISLSQIKRSQESGRGLALAAVIVGYVMVFVSIVLFALFILLMFILASTSGGHYGPGMMEMHGYGWNS